MWLVFLLCTMLIVLLIHGVMQQEHVRLWRKRQEILTERRRQEMDGHKRKAADKIKQMLSDRRRGVIANEKELAAAAKAAHDGVTDFAPAEPRDAENRAEEPATAEAVAANG